VPTTTTPASTTEGQTEAEVAWYFRHRRGRADDDAANRKRAREDGHQQKQPQKQKKPKHAHIVFTVPAVTFDGAAAGHNVYLALVLGGGCAAAAHEIKTKLGVPDDRLFVVDYSSEREFSQSAGEAGVDKIVFQTSAGPEAVARLRCPQALLAFVAMGSAPPASMSKQDATTWLGEQAKQSTFWDGAVALWREHDAAGRGQASSSSSAPSSPLSFRASTVRDGKHVYRSVDVSGAVGAACVARHGWRVDLTEYDINVMTIVTQGTFAIGLALPSGHRGPNAIAEAPAGAAGSAAADSAQPGKKKKKRTRARSCLPAEARPLLADDYHQIATLRPSTAHQMLLLADVQEGEVVCDCMCGVGTIPLESSAMGRVSFALGGEIKSDSLAIAGRSVDGTNAKAAAAGKGVGWFRDGNRELPDLPSSSASSSSSSSASQTAAALPVDFCGWNARRLPLRDNSIDVFIVDMPFGVSCKLNKKGMREILAEIARTLSNAPNARAVLLYQARKSFRQAVKRMAGLLHIDTCKVVNVGGLLVGLFVVKKGSGASAAAATAQ
jgi:hypothetical protein